MSTGRLAPPVRVAFAFSGNFSGRFPESGSPAARNGAAAWRDHPSWELVGEAAEVTGRDVAPLLAGPGGPSRGEPDDAGLVAHVLSLVALDAVQRVGIEAACYTGRGVHEYAALTAAGVVSVADGIRLAARRRPAGPEPGCRSPGGPVRIDTLDLRDSPRPVLASVDGRPYRTAAAWRRLLGIGWHRPLPWYRLLVAARDAGVTVLLDLATGARPAGDGGEPAGMRVLPVQSPADLDDVLGLLLGDAGKERAEPVRHRWLRIVASPADGVFVPHPGLRPGTDLAPGDAVGAVGDREIRCGFAGTARDVLAAPGQRVVVSQPIVTLHSGPGAPGRIARPAVEASPDAPHHLVHPWLVLSGPHH